MIGKFFAVALLSAFIGALLSEYGWKGKRAFGALCAILLCCAVLPGMTEIFTAVKGITLSTGISEVAEAALKVVGTGYVFGFAAEICTELGESGIAKCCGVVCRVEIFLIVLPYFIELIGAATELIK